MLVELFFACCDVVHPLHKLLEPIMRLISMKFKVSTLFCTTSSVNFSAQSYGKFSKVFTSLLSSFLLVVMLCTLCTNF